MRDLVIIGAGPAGYTAAIRASQLGRKVTLIEKDTLGGTCLNWGCIPTKALLKSAETYTDIKNASRLGINVDNISVNFPKIIARSRQIAQGLGRGVNLLMKKNNVEIINGQASFKDKFLLSIQSTETESFELKFKDLIIATGARPKLVAGFEPNGEELHTSRTILASEKQPKELLIIGAGAIGVEFAYFFNALGTRVTLVEMQGQILPQDDFEIAAEAQKIFTRRGMIIKTAAKVEDIKIQENDGLKYVHANIKTQNEVIAWQGDACLMAIGVTPNTDALNYYAIGLTLEHGYIKTNDKMQTNVEHIYAIGDITRPPLLAHKAAHEGLIAAESCAGLNSKMNYEAIPACAYCRPQIASIGLTEQNLEKNGIAYKVTKLPFISNGKAQAGAETEGFFKLITSIDENSVLGVHIIHAQAAELIAEAGLIINKPVQALQHVIHTHPSLSEIFSEAAAVCLGKPINA